MANHKETEEFLEHFGVKGMKWGHHTSTVTSAVSTAYKNRSTTQEIKDARARNKVRKAEIKSATKTVSREKTEQGKQKAQKILDGLKAEQFNSDDRRVGRKLTTGKKVALGWLLGPIGLAVVGVNIVKTRKQDG